MIPYPPECINCKHKTARRTCKAFPKGIPKEIYFEYFDHTKPFKGDKGIQFERKDGQ